MDKETETYEEKSQIEWSSAGKQFDLLKTLVAFANCDGGRLRIKKFIGDDQHLDSARLDDFVNKYVAPPVNGIASSQDGDGCWVLEVAKSPFAPHVIVNTGNYETKGRQKPAFYPGQVYVRHSSKSEPANEQDFQRMIREGVSSWLSSLGAAVAQVGFADDEDGSGVPMRIVDGGPALAISIEESHPYSATDLGRPFGKQGAWIGKLINREGMRDNIRYTKKLRVYSDPIYCYSEAARERVEKLLMKKPNYNPYASEE